MLQRTWNVLGRALRETGQALDRAGLRAQNKGLFKDHFTRHRPVMNLRDQVPDLSPGVFIAPNASVIGNVDISDNSSVWYGAVIKGDFSSVKIGGVSNIQEGCTITTLRTLDTGFPTDVRIGNFVTIGHGAILKSCMIGDNVLIGMGAVIAEGAMVEDNVVVAAGSVVAPGQLIKSGKLWGGNPAEPLRDLTDDEIKDIQLQATQYQQLADDHRSEFLPYGTQYWEAETLENN